MVKIYCWGTEIVRVVQSRDHPCVITDPPTVASIDISSPIYKLLKTLKQTLISTIKSAR